MSTLLYEVGTHRIVYKAEAFATGITVTAYIWNPSLTKSALQTFTEVEEGLYYLDYNFTVVGTYMGKFYEDGVAKTPGVFRIPEVDNDGTAISLAGALKLALSVLTGESSGGGTSTIVFRDIADTKTRISATVDASGNRTAVGTRDAT